MSLTVAELIELLKRVPQDAEVVDASFQPLNKLDLWIPEGHGSAKQRNQVRIMR